LIRVKPRGLPSEHFNPILNSPHASDLKRKSIKSGAKLLDFGLAKLKASAVRHFAGADELLVKSADLQAAQHVRGLSCPLKERRTSAVALSTSCPTRVTRYSMLS